MKVYGQLEAATLEVLASDPATTVQGRVWFNSTTLKPMLDDGTTKAALLRNDAKLIVGTNAINTNNVRIYRSSNACLQFVNAGQITAEGTTSTSNMASLDFKLSPYATASFPTAANTGRLLWDTTLHAVMVDDTTSWARLVSSRDYTAKGDLIGGTASNAFAKVTVGTNNQILVADSAQTAGLKWSTLVTNKGDLVAGTGSSAFSQVSVGTDNQILVADSAQTTGMKWSTLFVNKGDLVAGTGSGAYTQLPLGTLNQVLVADSTQTTGMKWATIGSGGTGKNYLGTVNGTNGNGDFELGATTGWSLFNTTLTGVLPTGSITAGAASVGTFQTVTSGKLAGGYSLNTASAAAWSAGQGFISDAFTIDIEDQAKVLGFKFAYKVSSGTVNMSGTSSNTFAVYIYEVGGSWIQPAGVYNLTQSSGVGICSGTFQTSASGTQYRLAVICINATGGAVSMLWDDFSVGPQTLAYGPNMSDWTSFTPTGSWSGTTSYTGRWKRLGDSVEIEWAWSLSGLATSSSLTLNLPSGMSIDTSKLPNWTGDFNIGQGIYVDTGAQEYVIHATPNGSSTTSIALRYYQVSGSLVVGTSPVNQTFPFAGNTGDFGNVRVRLPIVGFSSNSVQSSDTDTRVVGANYYGTPATSLTANTTYFLAFNTLTKDTHGAVQGAGSGHVTTSGTGWRYIVPVTGLYDITAAIQLQGPVMTNNQNLRIYLGVNGASVRNLGRVWGNGNNVAYSVNGTALAYPLNAGDRVEIIYACDVTATPYNNFEGQVSIAMRSGPATITATESVNARYYSSSSAISTTAADITFTTKDYDSHSAVSGATFTAPVSGRYEFKAKLLVQATYSAGNAIQLWAEKNGNAATAYGYSLIRLDSSSTASRSILSTDVVYMNAGDTLKIRAASDGTSPVIVSSTSNNYTIVRVGN